MARKPPASTAAVRTDPEVFHENFRLIPHPEYEDTVVKYSPAEGVEKFGAECGRRDCAYTTGEWDTPEQASARIAQHRDEHETGRVMQLLEDFEKDHGYERKDA